jgi:tetratricopeptide (TPR) repeat protein
MMLPQAEHCLQLAQNLDPQNMRIRFDLASLQLTHPDETKSQKARQFLEEVRKSGGEWAYMATRTLADYAWEKNLELAQSLYQETLRHNSEDWLSHLRLFLLSCRQDRDGAGSQIEALWNLAKSKTQKMELLLAILAELGAERVLEWQSKLQKDELDDARIRIVLIAALWDTGKYKEAAALATRQTSLKPPILERAMLQYWTYRCQLALKDEVAARLTMESIKNLMSEDALTAILFSNELFATGQHEIALPLLISAADVKNAGFSIIALESLFNYYKSRSDIDGLIWVHERMLTKFPGNAFIQNNLAMLLSYGQKDSARALKLAESAYFTAPSIPVFVSSYAQILCLNGKTSEALRLIQSIDWTDSQNITEGMKLQRAHVLYLNGMIKEAAECVENINTEGFLAQEIDILNQIKQTATTAVVSP